MFFVLRITEIPLKLSVSILYLFFPFKKETTLDFVLFSIPWSIFSLFCINSIIQSFLFQSSYFNLVCYYLMLKTKRLNRRLTKRIKKDSLKKILERLDTHYKLIMIYNNEMWNRLLTMLIINLINNSALSMYLAYFGNINAILSLIFSNISILILQLMTIIILPASQMSQEVIKARKILQKFKVRHIILKLKVEWI